MRKIHFASCLFHYTGPYGGGMPAYSSRSGTHGLEYDRVTLRNCALYKGVTSGGAEINRCLPSLGPSAGVAATAVQSIVGNIMQASDDAIVGDTWRVLSGFDMSVAGSHYNQNVLWKKSGLAHQLAEERSTSTTYANVATLNAESWATGNVQANLTIGADTGAISGGTDHQGIVTDITGVFESLTAGSGYTTEIDRTAGAWDAGAVQRDSLLVEDPTYIDEITLSGNLNGDDMELEWNLVTQDIDGYEVQRRIDGGSWETLTIT